MNEVAKRGRPLKKVVLKSILDTEGYCRKCRQILHLSNFYESPYVFLDTNGHMSICKKCCNKLYDKYFSLYNNIEKAMHCTCMDLDLRFSIDAVNATRSHIEKSMAKGQALDKIFGTYKSKLFSLVPNNTGIEGMRYKDSDKPVFGINDIGTTMNTNSEIVEDINTVMFWGAKFDIDDINYLEREYSLWKFQYRCEHQAEVVIFKEICIKTLEIRKLRAEGKPTQKAVEELQALMKTAGVDPARTKEIDSSKNKDTYGLWLKDIEEYEPVEYFEDKKMFVDFDEIKKYTDAFIFRPLKNLLRGSRDFNIGGYDESNNVPEDIIEYSDDNQDEEENGDFDG